MEICAESAVFAAIGTPDFRDAVIAHLEDVDIADYLDLEDRYAEKVEFSVGATTPSRDGIIVVDVTATFDVMRQTDCCDIAIPSAAEASGRITIDQNSESLEIDLTSYGDPESEDLEEDCYFGRGEVY